MSPAIGSSTRRVPLFWGISVLVLAGLALFLVVRRGTHSLDGRPVEPRSKAAGDRPDWLQPLEEETELSDRREGAAGASHLPPGEPGVLDVQAWDWLQQDLERIVDQTRAKARQRLSPEAFKAKFLGATVEFLELDDEATHAFESAVYEALEEIDSARAHMLRQQAHTEPGLDEAVAMGRRRAAWKDFTEAQRHAERHPLAVLDKRPRHQLLREEILKWLLRLDYGSRAAAR